MSGADSWGPLPPTPRAPLAAEIDLFGESEAVQVNHCRMPGCSNFGVPALTEHGKTGPSADRDPNYVVTGTNKGIIPAPRCKSCGEKPAMKSNAGVAADFGCDAADRRGRVLQEPGVRQPWQVGCGASAWLPYA